MAHSDLCITFKRGKGRSSLFFSTGEIRAGSLPGPTATGAGRAHAGSPSWRSRSQSPPPQLQSGPLSRVQLLGRGSGLVLWQRTQAPVTRQLQHWRWKLEKTDTGTLVHPDEFQPDLHGLQFLRAPHFTSVLSSQVPAFLIPTQTTGFMDYLASSHNNIRWTPYKKNSYCISHLTFVFLWLNPGNTMPTRNKPLWLAIGIKTFKKSI